LAPQEASKCIAERVDAIFQVLIEHVANHDHSALRPLSHAAELGVIELRLAPISLRERAEQGERHVKTLNVDSGRRRRNQASDLDR
jgi:hypothetical protein